LQRAFAIRSSRPSKWLIDGRQEVTPAGFAPLTASESLLEAAILGSAFKRTFDERLSEGCRALVIAAFLGIPDIRVAPQICRQWPNPPLVFIGP